MARKYTINTRPIKRPRGESCRGKAQYGKKVAIIVAKKLRRTGRMRDVRVYVCSKCERWHIANNVRRGKRK